MTSTDGSDARLPAEFFDRDVHDVARDLLGCRIGHSAVTVLITEVEAYAGVGDPGSHAYKGKTASTSVLFADPGSLYVYFTYGMYYCANLIAGQHKPGSGVLLRAGEVIEGRELARERRTRPGRPAPADRDLARGPARLAMCLALNRNDHNGLRPTDPDCAVRVSGPDSARTVGGIGTRIETGPRVGVSGPGGDAREYPWRYWISGDPTVSPYKGTTRRWRYAPRNAVAAEATSEAGLPSKAARPARQRKDPTP